VFLFRMLVLVATVLCSFLSVAKTSEPVDVMNFNFTDNWLEDGVQGFNYYQNYEEGCGRSTYEMGVFCDDKNRFFVYYTNARGIGSGWMRYGTMMPERNGYDGSALKIVFTGGKDKDEDGEFVEYGLPVYNYSQYEDGLRNNPGELHANRPLPSEPSMYMKTIDTFDTDLDVFEDANRFSVQVWFPANKDRQARYSRYGDDVSVPEKTLALYPFINASKGAHSYHHATNRAFGTWMKIQWDASPTHYNVGPYNDYHSYPEGGMEYPDDGVSYFDNMAAFSLRFHEARDSLSPYTILTDEWEAFKATYENEETIRNLGVGYDPETFAFDVSLEDKYRCKACTAKYQVKYSFEPITQENYDDALSPNKVESFFIEDDNAENLIIKPHAYYNQVWGKVFVSRTEALAYTNGATLYFAVKDLSERTIEVDPRDEQVVVLPNGANVKRNRLIKTISMSYRKPPPSLSEISFPNSLYLNKQELVSIPVAMNGLTVDDYFEMSAPYAIRPQFNDFEDGQLINFDPIIPGQFKLLLTAKKLDGSLLNSKMVDVNVDFPLCTDDPLCQYHTLVDYSDGQADLRYDEWSEHYNDPDTGLRDRGIGVINGSNGLHNVAGIRGFGYAPTSGDVLSINIINLSGDKKTVSPFVSDKSEERRLSDADALWQRLLIKELDNGESGTWLLPVDAFGLDTFSRISVSIPGEDNGVVLQSIGLNTKSKLSCSSCNNSLVDFYDGGENHSTPLEGWDQVIQDAYTGEVKGGMGIVIGSNRKYNYQGIKGTVDLSTHTSSVFVHWNNHSDETVYFYPRYSVEDDDRPSSGKSGEWFTQGEVIIPAEGVYIHEVSLPDGEIMLFNSNVNTSQKKKISLDRITMQ
jgi:hypothetical protein